MPLVRRVISIGSWVMLAMLTQYLVNATDNFMVGRLDSKELATASQAALGVSMPFFWAIGGFFAAISFGTQAMTARRFAKGDQEHAGQVLFNSLVLATVSGLLGGAIGYACAPWAMEHLASASLQKVALSSSYTQLRMLGIPGMVLTFSYKAFFDGIGKTHVHLWAALAMNLMNIILNYILIYGVEPLGIPSLGLDGSGIASAISTYVGLLLMLWVSLRPQFNKIYRFYHWHHRSWTIVRGILRLMIPSGFATMFLMAGFLAFMYIVDQIDAQLGVNTYSAATKAVMETAALCFMPLIAFGTATATAVSQSLGVGKSNLAARYGWESVRIGILAMLVVGTLFLLFPEQIISFWSPNDPQVAIAGARSLQLITTALPSMVIGLILSQALYGAGANTYVMVAEGILHVGILVPLTWLFGLHLNLGMEGIWLAATIYVHLLAVAMGIKFLGKGWRNIRI